ncbi:MULTISPECIES: hypothetical protein [unclassified Rhizobium]|uniref:hypothetical protein n=1 Tax=unclassified Rhizobium TaxID=2613769 RepID=UPI0038227E98
MATLLREGRNTNRIARRRSCCRAGHRSKGNHIRNLKTENSGNGKTLIVEGKIKDAVYGRISIARDGGELVRNIPIFLAN